MKPERLKLARAEFKPRPRVSDVLFCRELSSVAHHYLALVLSFTTILLPCPTANSQKLPSNTEILKRVLQRASNVASNESNGNYTYSRRSLVQELNSAGEVIESTEKEYEVVLIRGWPFSRLVRVQGKPLSEAEIRKEQRREEEFRNKIAGSEMKERKEKREAWITAELLARYDFNVISNDVCQNRKTWALQFKPKPSNPDKTIQDRICNRFAGTLWIDAEDAEIAKLDAHLTADLSLGWLGVLGSLTRCDLIMERQRMPEGVWVNANQTLLIHARKLISQMRYRATEESSGFRPEPVNRQESK